MIFQNQLVKSLKLNSDKTAIEYKGQKISYSALLSDANRVTHFLMSQQLEKETVIGIDLKDRSKIIASIIGVANAQCVFVLLDRSLPASRMEHIIQDLSLQYVITDEGMHANLSTSWLYDELQQTAPTEEAWSYPEYQEEDSLYIYFTSGSTGTPKGIIGKNCSLLQFLEWEIGAFEIDGSSRFSQFISPYFDAFLRDVFVPLLAGAVVCIPPEEEDFFSPEKIVPWIDDSQITTIHCVPSLFRQINIDTLTAGHFQNLSQVLMSGEKINPSELTNWYQIFADRIQLVNLYGATETTMIRSCYKIRPEDVKKSRMPIGSPIADTSILIVKKNMQPCGPLVPGDLYIVSNYLTKGYLNRPDLNQERFIKLNEGTAEETIAYKTGDKARKLVSGQIELLGREDRQVKLRGIRIELDEIEVTLMNSGLLSNAVVLLREEEKEPESLIAFLIKKDESRESAALQKAISEYMTSQVPAYMVPANLIFVEEYPLLPNGKINLKGLLSLMVAEREIVAPVNATEEKILSIWKEVLGEKSISTEDSFHQIGGNSLSLMSLIARINKEFQIRISLSQLFKNATIKKQAAFIEDNTVTTEETAGIPVAKKADHYPLSSSQNQLFFLYKFDPDSIAYNMPSVFKLEGELNKERFQSVFEKLIAHHEILRTSFELVDEIPVQFVADQADFEIEHYPSNEDETAAVIHSFIRPFDLSAAPLIRVGLIEAGLNEHLLMVDLHHMISDGASREILIKEFMTLYNGEQLPEAKLNFKDFTTWQQSEARQESILKQSEFWLKEFSEEVEALDLPTDFVRPAVKQHGGKVVSFEIGKEETAKVEAIAESEGATMFMVMLSAFYILLAKLSNQEDIVVGTPVAGRHQAGLENMVGMFVNGLCLRNRPESNMSYKAFLSTVKANVLSCLENQDYTYDELIEAVKVERDISRNPLFDVMFSYQNYEKTTLEIPGLVLSQVPSDQSISKYDMTLFVFEADGELMLDIEYATSLFEEKTIERFVGYFKKIVSAITTDLSKKIADIEILSNDEKTWLLNDFNNTEQAADEAQAVTSIFKKCALEHGNKTALVFNGEKTSYQELDDRSDQLAKGIKKHVQQDEYVGILMERSPELIISIMGVLKAGCAYVPIDPEYPISRIKHIAEDSGLGVVLTSPATQEVADQLPENVVSVNVTSEELYSEPGELLNDSPSLSSIAYVIYTSGSTGHPKGVMVSHGALLNYIHWAAKQYVNGEKSSFALYSSIAFDLTITSIFTPLITGNEIIIYQENQEKASLIEEVLESDEANIIKLTPTHLKLIRDCKLDGANIKNLKKLIVGGEELTYSQAKEVHDKLGGEVVIYNEYGPTEATVGCMIHQFDPEEVRSTVPIGVPIDNIQIYVLDTSLNPVPQGARGELYIAGEGVAAGYIGADELTREKFLVNPFATNQKMYKTGDMARIDGKGHVVFIGRVDHQVKIRGFRIEPGEIESELVLHDQISETVVVVKEKGDDKLLTAYYLSEKPLEVAELRAFLIDKLPLYMLPSFYVHLQSFPLTPNGKLDRKALPDADLENSDGFIAPATDIEIKLTAMWAEILNVNQNVISTGRSFFELGAHSLNLITLVNKIFKEYGISILLKDVFTHQNIKSLGALIAKSVKSEYTAIQKAAPKPHYPLSQAQMPLFFHHELNPSSLIRNLTFVAEVEGNLDKEKLESIFKQLIARHDSLRTAFKLIDSEPVQVIADDVDFEIAHASAKREHVDAVIKDFVKLFDISQAPLFRAGLVELEDNSHMLMVDVHHLIADGLSLEILKDELLALYNDEELPALETQYSDFVEWQQGGDYLKKIDAQKEFWLNEFAEPIQPLEVPLDYNSPEEAENEGARIAFEIGVEKTQALRQIADSQGATAAMVVLSIFNILLSKLSRQEDIVVGIPLSGREQVELEPVVGMFAKALPVRNYPKANLSFEAFLSEVKYKFFSALDNQSYPYEELANELNIVRNTDRNPWFDVMFSFEHYHASELNIPDLKIKQYPGKEVLTDQNLGLDATEQEDEILLELNYSKALFRKETAAKFVQYFRQITDTILENPKVSIAQIEIVKEEEKQRLLFELNGPKKDLNREKVYSDLFKEQVDRTPDHIAVEHNGATLTYQELYDRSVDLATYLVSKGVNASTRVGIYMPRGIDMLVSILGVLRAGSAYVPIDVYYPEKRVDEIVKDSELSLVITNARHKGDFDEIFESSPSLEELLDIHQLPLIKVQNGSAPSFSGTTNELAYIIYTSGTTGKPKGVMIHQMGMINHLFAKIDGLEIGADDVIAQTASPCFDISVWQFLAALMVGGKTYVIDKDKVVYPDTLCNELQSGKVSIFESVPSLMTNFLDDLPDDHGLSLKALRWMVPTGEALSVALAKKWYEYFPDIKLLNAYGPTEASDDVTHYVVAPPTELDHVIPIGKPLPNTHIFILNEYLGLCPIGVRGEICVAGLGVGKGYWQNQEKTSGAFVANPFLDELGDPDYAILYKTGDIGYYQEDGNIIYAGRKDDQLKINGNRIEIGEIESRLSLHEAVKEAAVMAFGEGTSKYLVAYYVSEQPIDQGELRTYLTNQLPDYMVPSFFEKLEIMPLTANGKLNRNALPEPKVRLDESYIKPTTPTEIKLCEIWSQVLKIDSELLSVGADFFSLGGNSLMSISLIGKMHKALNVKISLRDFFENPTIQSTAEYIEDISWLTDDSGSDGKNKIEINI